LRTEYTEYETVIGETSYLRRDRLKELGEVDVVVFDCDGVLLDVRESYSRAVAETTSILMEAMTGVRIPRNLFDGGLNRAYKRTGGFNNDWTLSYALTMRTLAELPESVLGNLGEVAGETLRYDTPRDRLDHFRENKVEAEILVETLYERLHGFAEDLDSSGVEAVDKALLKKLGPNIKMALGYPGIVGESVISTLFEEVLCGADLFERSHGFKAAFTAESTGFIENETLIVHGDTIEKLMDLLGGDRIGIASGSLYATAMHVLGDSISQIRREAQVWYENVEEAQRRREAVGLHKPAPYSLLRASKPFKPYDRILYVGDTLADRLMVRNAGEPKFMFAGVYGNVHNVDEARDDFLSSGSDIVAPTVNDLPELLRYAGGETI